jgi:hypothetical protein
VTTTRDIPNFSSDLETASGEQVALDTLPTEAEGVSTTDVVATPVVHPEWADFFRLNTPVATEDASDDADADADGEEELGNSISLDQGTDSVARG